MTPLMLHPDCEPGPVRAISAKIAATPSGCDAVFRIEGALETLHIPVHDAAVRQDNLWKTTCFEIFWQPEGGDYYREFNLSPSSKWAAYDFDGFRKNGRDAPVNAIAIACAHDGKSLELKASIAAELPTPANIALNAITEDAQGNIQFWALAFPPGKPEFHSEVCRRINMDRSQ